MREGGTAARGQQLSVWREGQCPEPAYMSLHIQSRLFGIEIKDMQLSSVQPGKGHRAMIGIEGHCNKTCPRITHSHLNLAGCCIPQIGAGGAAAFSDRRDQATAIGRESHGGASRVMYDHLAILRLPAIPHLDFTVPAPRNDIVAAGDKCKSGDPSGMSLDAVKLAMVCIPKPNH